MTQPSDEQSGHRRHGRRPGLVPPRIVGVRLARATNRITADNQMREQRMGILTRVVGAATVLAVLSLPSPASGDQPTVVRGTDQVVADNPCSGATEVLTIEFVAREHTHGDRTVSHVHRSGTSSGGSMMVQGVRHLQINGQIASARIRDDWRHPDGSRFVASGRFLMDLRTDETRFDRFEVSCIRA